MGVKRVKRVTYKGHFGGTSGPTRKRRKPNPLHRTRVADDVVLLNLKPKFWRILISVPLPPQAKDHQVSTSCLEKRPHWNSLSSLGAIIGEKFKAKPMRPKFSRMVLGINEKSYLLFGI